MIENSLRNAGDKLVSGGILWLMTSEPMPPDLTADGYGFVFFLEGETAAKAGKLETACPYETDSEPWRHWLAGWREAWRGPRHPLQTD